MAAIDFRATYFFTTVDGFGYTQTYYITDVSYGAALAKCELCVPLFADVLDPAYAVAGLRVSNDLPGTRDSVFSRLAYPFGGLAPAGLQRPQSNVALLIRMDSNPTLQGRKFFHGVPTDHYPDGNKFIPNLPYKGALEALFNQFFANQFELRQTVAPGKKAPFAYFPIATAITERMVTRRVGRPFGLEVGRRRIR